MAATKKQISGAPVFNKQQQREAKILEWRKAGMKNKEIARRLGLSEGYLQTITRKMIRQRLIYPRVGSPSGGLNLKDAKVKTIIKYRKLGVSASKIGQLLGISCQAVCQRIAKLEADYGGKILAPTQTFKTLTQVAKELKTSTDLLRLLCRTKKLSISKKGSGGRYLIGRREFRRLKRALIDRRLRICTICGRSFTLHRRAGRAVACSAKCRRQLNRQRHLSEAGLKSKSTGWHKTLRKLLKRQRQPEKEKWLGLTEACRLTGLSQVQVRYLLQTRLVSTKKHPIRKWHGRPMLLYSMSGLKLAKKAYGMHQKNAL